MSTQYPVRCPWHDHKGRPCMILSSPHYVHVVVKGWGPFTRHVPVLGS